MPARRERGYEAEPKARWEAMIDEAMVECYDEYEAFAGMLATLRLAGRDTPGTSVKPPSLGKVWECGVAGWRAG
jgi:hypothetical protein